MLLFPGVSPGAALRGHPISTAIPQQFPNNLGMAGHSSSHMFCESILRSGARTCQSGLPDEALPTPGLREWGTLGDLQFVSGVGRGSMSLVTHLSSWTLISISGFTSALAHVLQRSLASRSLTRYPPSCSPFLYYITIIYFGRLACIINIFHLLLL